MQRTTKLNVLEILRGLWITLAHIGRAKTTVVYPDVRPKLYPRFRGLHRLERYEDGPFAGMEKCIGCALCAAACPANVITVIAAENTDEHRVSPGERYAEVYDMDILRCIFCGLCVEACPTEAIVMKHDFELSDDERWAENKFLYRKEDLLDRPYQW